MLQRRDTVEKGHLGSGNDGWINVCYFTNWARYRTGLVNEGRDAFEMGLDGSLCTHFMYGFATVTPDFMLKSNDPNADHPSGSESQDGLCPEECNDPSFSPDWSDPDGVRCEWPCSATRVRRGYEALTVGMKQKNSAIKALISVGGWNFNDCTASSSATYGQGAATCELFSEIAADEGKTRTFAANVIAFCRKWGFDGFDLDWEYPVVEGHNRVGGGESPEDYANYVRMLRILKEEFQKESSTPLLLTAAVGVGKSTADTAYDIPGMSQYLDLINLMTYDLHGSWEATTGCNAPLYATAADELKAGYPLSVSWAVNYWLEKGAPASKLTLGLPTYGRGWKLSGADRGFNADASGPCSQGSSTGQAGYLAYYEIRDIQERDSEAFTRFDSERVCAYVVSDGEWIGYDDEATICAKLAFAREKGLAGSMVWALDLDDMDGSFSGRPYPLISLMSTAGMTCPDSSSQRPTTDAPVTTQPATTAEPTTVSTTRPASTTTEPASTTASTTAPAPATTAAATTVAATTTTTPGASSTGACVRNPSCDGNAWCNNMDYVTWCPNNAGSCPEPMCMRRGASTTGGTETTVSATMPATTATTTPSACTATAEAKAGGFGASDAACTAACQRLPSGMWPCGEGGLCVC